MLAKMAIGESDPDVNWETVWRVIKAEQDKTRMAKARVELGYDKLKSVQSRLFGKQDQKACVTFDGDRWCKSHDAPKHKTAKVAKVT